MNEGDQDNSDQRHLDSKLPLPICLEKWDDVESDHDSDDREIGIQEGVDLSRPNTQQPWKKQNHEDSKFPQNHGPQGILESVIGLVEGRWGAKERQQPRFDEGPRERGQQQRKFAHDDEQHHHQREIQPPKEQRTDTDFHIWYFQDQEFYFKVLNSEQSGEQGHQFKVTFFGGAKGENYEISEEEVNQICDYLDIKGCNNIKLGNKNQSSQKVNVFVTIFTQKLAVKFFQAHLKAFRVTGNIRGVAYLLKPEELFIEYGLKYADEYRAYEAKEKEREVQREHERERQEARPKQSHTPRDNWTGQNLRGFQGDDYEQTSHRQVTILPTKQQVHEEIDDYYVETVDYSQNQEQFYKQTPKYPGLNQGSMQADHYRGDQQHKQSRQAMREVKHKTEDFSQNDNFRGGMRQEYPSRGGRGGLGRGSYDRDEYQDRYGGHKNQKGNY